MVGIALPETNSQLAPEKRPKPKRKAVFQSGRVYKSMLKIVGTELFRTNHWLEGSQQQWQVEDLEKNHAQQFFFDVAHGSRIFSLPAVVAFLCTNWLLIRMSSDENWKRNDLTMKDFPCFQKSHLDPVSQWLQPLQKLKAVGCIQLEFDHEHLTSTNLQLCKVESLSTWPCSKHWFPIPAKWHFCNISPSATARSKFWIYWAL